MLNFFAFHLLTFKLETFIVINFNETFLFIDTLSNVYLSKSKLIK